MHLGKSTAHASKVALVLNLATGHVSPQCHVVFDDNFFTVGHLTNSEDTPKWEQLVRDHSKDIDPSHTDLDSTRNFQNVVDETSSEKMRENMTSNTIIWADEHLDNIISRSEPIRQMREDNFNAIIPDKLLDFAGDLIELTVSDEPDSPFINQNTISLRHSSRLVVSSKEQSDR